MKPILAAFVVGFVYFLGSLLIQHDKARQNSKALSWNNGLIAFVLSVAVASLIYYSTKIRS